MSRHALHSIVAVSALVLLTCSCGDDDVGDVDTAMDSHVLPDTALPDTSRRDTQRDTASDVPDTSVDTTIDAGDDDPGWRPMPGLPDGCVIERADHPERLLHIEWLSCGDGCTYLAPDPGNRFQRAVTHLTGHPNRRAFVVAEGRWDEPESARSTIHVVADETQVFAAWRQPRFDGETICRVLAPTLGGGRTVFIIQYILPTRAGFRFHFVDFTEAGAEEVPTVVLSPPELPATVSLSDRTMSDALFVTALQPAGDLFLLRPNGEYEIQRLEGNAQNPRVVGDDVFFERWENGYTKLMHTRFGEEAQILVQAEGAHIVGTAVTEDAISWNRAVSDGRVSESTLVELYTAAFATRAEDLVPRLVVQLAPDGPRSGWTSGVSGEGFYFTRFPFQGYRLSDGAILTAPIGEPGGPGGLEGFLWVDDEVATAAVLSIESEPHGTVRRRTLSSLVPWTP